MLAEQLKRVVDSEAELPWHVASFSKRHDNVRLWTEYADQKRGVCIELDTDTLAGLGCPALEIRYGESNWKTLWEPLVHELIARQSTINAATSLGKIAFLAGSCKHQCGNSADERWEEEEEIRIFGTVPPAGAYANKPEVQSRVAEWRCVAPDGKVYAEKALDLTAVKAIYAKKEKVARHVQNLCCELGLRWVNVNLLRDGPM